MAVEVASSNYPCPSRAQTMLRMRNVWMPIQRRSITMSTMSSRRSSIVFYAIVASNEMRHTIHSVNANIENELSSPQNDRHRLHGIRCILWNGIPRNLLILHCLLNPSVWWRWESHQVPLLLESANHVAYAYRLGGIRIYSFHPSRESILPDLLFCQGSSA